MNFSFTGLSDNQIKKIVESEINGMSDSIANFIGGAFFKEYQLSGETLQQTMIRLIEEVTTFNSYSYVTGFSPQSGLGSIAEIESLSRVYDSNGAGGMAGLNKFITAKMKFNSVIGMPTVIPNTENKITHPSLTDSELSSAQSLLFNTAAANNSTVDYSAIFEQEATTQPNFVPLASYTGSNSIFKFQAAAGTTYDIYSIDTFGILFPPEITLFDNTGKPIVVSQDTGTEDSKIMGFTASYTGTYYIDAGWYKYAHQNFVDLQIDSHIVNHQPTGRVSITGTAQFGKTLTGSDTLADTDGLGKIGYQWLNDGNIIYGANQKTYTVQKNDAGGSISVVASYTDGLGKLESVTSNVTTKIPVPPPLKVSINGYPYVGKILTESDTVLESTNYSGQVYYQWFAGNSFGGSSPIYGETKKTHMITPDDFGKSIYVSATYYDNSTGYNSIKSQPTQTISGATIYKLNSIQGSGISSDTRAKIDFNRNSNDKIDLSSIDADTITLGDQSFTKLDVGSKFSGKCTATGQLFFDAKTHILWGNVDTNADPDFSIQINGVAILKLTDLIL